MNKNTLPTGKRAEDVFHSLSSLLAVWSIEAARRNSNIPAGIPRIVKHTLATNL
jgi:hypothetical protein